MGPISNLDDELLYYLFVNSVWSSTVSPWTLAAVCTRWRGVCLESPLWSRFNLNVAHNCGADADAKACNTYGPASQRTQSSNPVLALFDIQLQRSGQTIPIEVRCTEAMGACATQMRLRLDPCHARWQSLVLRFPKVKVSTGFTVHCPSFQGATFSALKHLHFICAEVHPSMDSGPGFRLLGPVFTTEMLPALESLRIDDWKGDNWCTGIKMSLLEPGSADPPWSQLRHIHLVGWSSDYISLLRMLQACPNITHFALRSGTPGPPKPGESLERYAGHPTVLLKRLVQLELNCAGDSDVSRSDNLGRSSVNIIRHLCAPKLHTLAISSCGNLCGGSLDEDIGQMIRRSGCAIRCLDLNNWKGLGSKEPLPLFFTQVSQSVQELTSLGRDDPGFASFSILPCMVAPHFNDNSTDLLFPQLKILQISGLESAPRLVENVVRSRQELATARGGAEARINALERVEIYLSEYKWQTSREEYELALQAVSLAEDARWRLGDNAK